LDITENKIAIGEFTVWPAHNKIILNDQEFQLEPKIMEVLCYFIQNKQQVLSKQKILDDLWPGQIIGHEVITRAVFELRKIFKDDAKNAKFISTISRKGYCFIHEVTFEIKAHKSTISIENAQNSVSKRKNSFTLLTTYLAAVTVLLVLFVIIFTYDKNIGNDTNIALSNLVPKNTSLLSHQFEQVNTPRFSPDGKTLILTAEQNGQSLLVKSSLDNLTQQVLVASSEQIISPVWINNQNVIYSSCQERKCQLIKKAINSDVFEPVADYQANIQRLSINLNKQLLLVEKIENGAREFDIISLADNSVLPVAIIGNTQYSTIDSQNKLVYYLKRADTSLQQLYAYDINNARSKIIPITFDRIFDLAAKNGGELLISGRRQGESGIWLLNTSNNSIVKFVDAGPGEVIREFDFNDETQQLIHKIYKRNIDIGIKGLSLAFENVNSDLIDMNGLYDKKRKQLFFISNRTGFYELWLSKDNQLTKLTNLRANVIERPILSTDFSKLAFTYSQLNETLLRIYDIELGQISPAYKLPSVAHLLNWHESKDSIFYSASVNGNYAIYRYDITQQESKPVALNAGLIYQQDSEGNLYYGQISSRSLMKQTPTGEVSHLFKIPTSALPLRPHQVALIDNSFYFINREIGNKVLIKQDLNKAIDTELAVIPENAYTTQIANESEVFIIYDQFVDSEKRWVITDFQ